MASFPASLAALAVAFHASCVLSACSDSSGEGAPPGNDSAVVDTEIPTEDSAPPACTAAISKGPWVVAVDETSAKVRWESCVVGPGGLSLTPEAGGATTKVASRATLVTISTTIDVPLLKDADYAGTFIMHEVALTGLVASTCYAYALDADAGVKGRFCTARAPGDPFTFRAIGDTNPGLGVASGMVSKAYEQKADFTIHAGDVQYYASFLETWTSWMAAMSPMLRGGAFFPSVGNHENERPTEKADYYDRFWGSAGFDGTNDYYRFATGGVWFFSLDTELDVSPKSVQGAWLESQLLDAQSKPGFRFSVVFFHRPFATCGDSGSNAADRAAYTPIFEKTGVKLVVQGHMHGYERFEIGGLTYLTTAGGGGALGNVDENITRPECADRKASGKFFHTVLFEVSTGQLKGTVTDDKGAVRDTFSKVVP